MRIENVLWFCGRSVVGIVQVWDEHDGLKYYIGAPPGPEEGNTEHADMEWIADWGSRFPTEAGHKLFGVRDDSVNAAYEDAASICDNMSRKMSAGIVHCAVAIRERIKK